MDKVFWNVYCSAPGGMADGGQFKISSISKHIRERFILSLPVIRLQPVDIQPYLLGRLSLSIAEVFAMQLQTTERGCRERAV